MATPKSRSSRRFTQIRPGAPATPGQKQNYDQIVSGAVQEIDSMNGPDDPNNPGNPFCPGWVRMSTQEKIRAVIDAIDEEGNLKNRVGPLSIRLEKDVKDAYAAKHSRKK